MSESPNQMSVPSSAPVPPQSPLREQERGPRRRGNTKPTAEQLISARLNKTFGTLRDHRENLSEFLKRIKSAGPQFLTPRTLEILENSSDEYKWLFRRGARQSGSVRSSRLDEAEVKDVVSTNRYVTEITAARNEICENCFKIVLDEKQPPETREFANEVLIILQYKKLVPGIKSFEAEKTSVGQVENVAQIEPPQPLTAASPSTIDIFTEPTSNPLPLGKAGEISRDGPSPAANDVIGEANEGGNVLELYGEKPEPLSFDDLFFQEVKKSTNLIENSAIIVDEKKAFNFLYGLPSKDSKAVVTPVAYALLMYISLHPDDFFDVFFDLSHSKDKTFLTDFFTFLAAIKNSREDELRKNSEGVKNSYLVVDGFYTALLSVAHNMKEAYGYEEEVDEIEGVVDSGVGQMASGFVSRVDVQLPLLTYENKDELAQLSVQSASAAQVQESPKIDSVPLLTYDPKVSVAVKLQDNQQNPIDINLLLKKPQSVPGKLGTELVSPSAVQAESATPSAAPILVVEKSFVPPFAGQFAPAAESIVIHDRMAPLSVVAENAKNIESVRGLTARLTDLIYFMRGGDSIVSIEEVAELFAKAKLSKEETLVLLDSEIVADFMKAIREQRVRIEMEKEKYGDRIIPQQSAYFAYQLEMLIHLEELFKTIRLSAGEVEEETRGEKKNEAQKALEKKEGLKQKAGRVIRSALSFGGRLVRSAYKKSKPFVVETLGTSKKKIVGGVRSLGSVISSIKEGMSMVRDPSIVKGMIQESRKDQGDAVAMLVAHNESDILSSAAPFQRRPEGQQSEEAVAARSSLLEKFKKGVEFYDKQHPAVKYSISLSLIGIGIVGTMTGMTAVTGAAIVGRTVLRAASATVIGGGAATFMRAQNKEGNALSRFAHNNAGAIGVTTGVLAFIAGSFTDFLRVSEIVSPSSLSSHVPTSVAVPQTSANPLAGAVFSQERIIPDSPASAVPGFFLPENPELGKVFSSMPMTPDAFIAPLAQEFVSQIPIIPGDTAIGIVSNLANGGLEHILGSQLEEFKALSVEAKKAFVENLIANLPKDAAEELGISSGEFAHMMPGKDAFNFDKLAEMAKSTVLIIKGEKTNLIERAFKVATNGKI